VFSGGVKSRTRLGDNKKRPLCIEQGGVEWIFKLNCKGMERKIEGFECSFKTLVFLLLSTPGGTRTPDLTVRSRALYPAELQAHIAYVY
jgi:hypothetical protein